MKGFEGFPAGKQPYTPVPNLFFSELLPDIDHLAELKVTLHVFWLLAQKKGERRSVSGQELSEDARLLQGLASPGLASVESLRDALERAVARRSLLRVFASVADEERDWYFLNSEQGRRAVEDLLAGKWSPVDSGERIYLQAQTPNIFVLFEQNIGPLTPMLAEELMEAEKTYPAAWIEDAFREAVRSNARNWRYAKAVLKHWADGGKPDETSRPRDEDDWRRFIEGDYADYFEQ
jgi:DnaD/phage-associated family protein